MSKTEEQHDRIQQLEHENSALQQAVDELQQKIQQEQNPFYTPPVSFHRSPMDYIDSEFWSKPANPYWNLPKMNITYGGPRLDYFKRELPGLVTDGDFFHGYGLCVSEDEPEQEENNALKLKVGELKKKIEKLEKKLKGSPLKYVIAAIKKTARYDSPSAAFKLFEQQDYIYKDCEQWRENVGELEDFLLREKNKALLPPPPSVNYPTDQQMADAISSICGEGKALDEYQNWLGVCCYASARCGYPLDLKMCCERLKQLPYRSSLFREVKYENIRMFSNWNFVKAGYDQWPSLKVNDQERTLFVKCRDTAVALDNALINIFR